MQFDNSLSILYSHAINFSILKSRLSIDYSSHTSDVKSTITDRNVVTENNSYLL